MNSVDAPTVTKWRSEAPACEWRRELANSYSLSTREERSRDPVIVAHLVIVRDRSPKRAMRSRQAYVCSLLSRHRKYQWHQLIYSDELGRCCESTAHGELRPSMNSPQVRTIDQTIDSRQGGTHDHDKLTTASPHS
jgi:hypothetical protein